MTVLETSLSSQPQGGALAFELTVENHGDQPVDLSFSDAQRVRVSIYPADASEEVDPVWRSDADQMYAQVVGEETVPAAGSISFNVAWDDPDSGEYRAVGEVTARERELRDETTVLV